MNKYTIVGGVNGSGKSSLTGVLKELITDLGYIIDVDKIAYENGKNNLLAGKIAIKKINNFLQKGVNFTQETTLSGKRTEKSIKLAKAHNYYIRLYYVGLDTCDECVKRIKNRVLKGGHDIPKDDVERRFNTRFKSLINILPYCDEVHFYDNDNGFKEVAEYKNGEIIINSNSIPKWIAELKQQYTMMQNNYDENILDLEL